MLRLWLIRHGQTPGNRLHRYIGITDESLCPEEYERLGGFDYPCPEMVFSSPMKRCLETASVLFPGKEPYILPDLSECNFGRFENRNYLELSGDPDYQRWIDSDGTLPFPGGESREEFRRRNLEGFAKGVEVCRQREIARAAFVIHGGTIMNLMESLADVRRSFYGWHLENGEGYLVQLESGDGGGCGLSFIEEYRWPTQGS